MNKFETNSDIQSETYIAENVARKWKCTFERCAEYYPIDIALMRGKNIMALAEIKNRLVHKNEYDDYALSLAKFVELKTFADKSALQVMLIVSWVDETAYVDVASVIPKSYSFMRRSVQRYAGDNEPMVNIALDDFTTIYKGD